MCLQERKARQTARTLGLALAFTEALQRQPSRPALAPTDHPMVVGTVRPHTEKHSLVHAASHPIAGKLAAPQGQHKDEEGQLEGL